MTEQLENWTEIWVSPRENSVFMVVDVTGLPISMFLLSPFFAAIAQGTA